MSDILYNAAIEYKKLRNTTYEILLGRKGVLYTIVLHFPPESFFHLVGLQHLTDITFPSTNKERIFKEILSKKVTIESINKSLFYEKSFIEERISNLYLLEHILDSNSITYLINGKKYIQYTTIKADYLFEYKDIKMDIFYFFIIKERICPRFKDESKGCSFFKKHENDYTYGTSKTTVLLITKYLNYRRENEQSVIKYKNPAYKENS